MDRDSANWKEYGDSQRASGAEKSVVKEFGTGVAEFSQSLFHSAVENPVNGVVQLVDHASGASLPELHIAGVPNSSTASSAGAIAGSVVDFWALTKFTGPALGELGGTGTSGAILRSAIVGGVYSGVFQPSDARSEHFVRDRLANSTVGAITFASMTGSGALLNKTDMFAIPEARSFLGSVAYGGLNGVAGGLAHAEASALLKHGQLASVHDLYNDARQYGAFGAAFGGLDYAYYRATLPSHDAVTEQGDWARVTYDKKGNIVIAEGTYPLLTSYGRVGTGGFTYRRMPDGTFDNALQKSNADWVDEAGLRDPLGGISDVARTSNGTIRVWFGGQVRNYTPDGPYRLTGFSNSSLPQKDGTTLSFMQDNFLDTNVITKENHPESIDSLTLTPRHQYDFLYRRNIPEPTYFQNVGPKQWQVTDNHLVYDWKGDIKPIPSPGSTKVEAVEFTPLEGQGARVTSTSGRDAVMAVLRPQLGEHVGIEPGYAYIRADAQGNLFAKSDYLSNVQVNGKTSAQVEVPIKPGDKIEASFEYSDRESEWDNVPLTIGKGPDGAPTVNGQPVGPKGVMGLRTLYHPR